MSRLEQALRRAAGVLSQDGDFSDALGDEAEDELQRYPHETKPTAPAVDAAIPLPNRTIPTRTTDKSQLGLHPPVASAAVPVNANAAVPNRPHAFVVPRTTEKGLIRGHHSAMQGKLVVSRDVPQTAVEQYRRLAGILQQLQVEQGLKTVMVTSALPGEGKTLTVVNLALSLSEFCEQRVLLIDADVRRPFVHQAFQLSNLRGLSDVLSSEAGDVPLQQVSERLTVLPAGRFDEPMALTSDRMRVLLEKFGAEFDWVLVDVPPVGFMPDAELLARLTGAVIFVIAANSTPYPLVSRSVAALDPHRIIGTVLNGIDEQNIPSADYYREYYASDMSAE